MSDVTCVRCGSRFDPAFGNRAARICGPCEIIHGPDQLASDHASVGAVIESIETNMWQAEGYYARGAQSLGDECLRAAWAEFVRFRDHLPFQSSPAFADRCNAAAPGHPTVIEIHKGTGRCVCSRCAVALRALREAIPDEPEYDEDEDE